MMIKRLYALLAISALSFIVSCSRENVVDPSTSLSKSLQKANTYAVEGILVFKSMNHLQDFSENYNFSDYNSRRSFEEKVKFTSLATTIDHINKQSVTEIESYANANKGLVKYESGQARHAIFANDIASLVNSKGYVIIGATLFQFTTSKISTVSLLKSEGLKKAISAIEGDGSLQALVKSTDVIREIKSLPNARYNLGDNTMYNQTNQISTQYHLDCGFCRSYAYQLSGYAEVISFYNYYEYCDEYLPYDEDCRCYSCVGTPHVDQGWFARVQVRGSFIKKYQNGDTESANANYIRLKSTNAVIYADYVAYPSPYDERRSNVNFLDKDVWVRYQNGGGTRTHMEVDATFEYEAQVPSGETITTSVIF